MKRVLTLMAAILVFTTTGLAASTKTVQEYYKEKRTVLENYEEILAVAQSGYKVGGKYFSISENIAKTGLDLSKLEIKDDWGTDISTAAKFIFAALACGKKPAEFAGRDVVKFIVDRQNAENGSFNPSAYTHSFILLALDAAGASYNKEKAVKFLKDSQIAGGGWGFETFPDADTTAIAISALANHEGTAENISNGVKYLETLVQPDGGFLNYEGDDSSNSAAVALLALVDAGVDIDQSAKFKNIPAKIETFKNTDGSYKAYLDDDDTSDALATKQVFLALEAYKNKKSVYKFLASGGTFAFALENPVTVPETSSQPVSSQPQSQNPGTGDSALLITAFLALISLSFLVLSKKLQQR